MPTSFEGLTYERYLFKPVDNSETGGCHADVYLPDASITGPYPIALHIHGGGFTTGDTFHLFIGHIQYLLKRGVCVVSVEYRMAPQVRFDEMREDWVDAYRWVKTDLKGVTNGKVDPSRVFVFGGSAGGTATLFLALDVQTAGLPPPQALYVVYPAVKWDSILARDDATQVDYARLSEVSASLPEEKQVLLRELLNGPICTAYDCKNEASRPLTGRRVWYDLMMQHPFLVSCILRHPGPPYPAKYNWFQHVSKDYPPTVLIKAMADTLVDPQQTTDVYVKLQELGVESKVIEAQGMLHGDLEGENDMLDHPPREALFWRDVYSVALDWCISRISSPEPRVKIQVPNGGGVPSTRALEQHVSA